MLNMFSIVEMVEATALYLWGVLIKQAYLDTYIHMVLLGLLLLVIPSWWIAAKQLMQRDDMEPFVVAMSCVIFIILIIGVPMLSYSVMTGLLNPEYKALDRILDSAYHVQ